MPTVTPGHVFASGETITEVKLNLLGTPGVAINSADLTSIASSIGAAASALNWLRNSDFRAWTLGTTVSLPATTWTERADSWEAYATYTTTPTTFIQYARIADGVHDYVLYAVKFTGETSGSAVKFGQRISAAVAAAMLQSKATLTIELENKTGASQTPVIYFETCDAFEDYSAMTARVTASQTPMANNARTTITYTLDLSSVSASFVRNGGRISVSLPGLTSGSKEWQIYYTRLEPGDTATPRRIERDATGVSATAGDAVNYLPNGSFNEWLAQPVTCLEDIENIGPAGWVVIPSDGSTGILSRYAGTPTGKTLFSGTFTGAAAVTGTLDIACDIPRITAAALLEPLVFSIAIYNATGASFTPSFRIDTSDATNSETRTNRLTQPLAACANVSWTVLTWAFDATAYTNFANGARLTVRIPSGSLDSTFKAIRFAQGSLIRGALPVAMLPEPPFVPGPLASTASTATGLVITRPTVATILVTCAACVLERSDGSLLTVRNVSTTINLGANGANGVDIGSATAANSWYSVYIISNGETTAALVHREDHTGGALDLPAGYQWCSGIVGSIRSTTSGNARETTQRGDMVLFLPVTLYSGSVSVANAYEICDNAITSAAVPKAARRCSGSFGTTTGTGFRASLAADSSGAGQSTFIIPNSANAHGSFTGGSAGFSLTFYEAQKACVMADDTAFALLAEITSFQL